MILPTSASANNQPPRRRAPRPPDRSDEILYEAAYVIGLLAAADAFELGAPLAEFRRFAKEIARTRCWPPAVLREVIGGSP